MKGLRLREKESTGTETETATVKRGSHLSCPLPGFDNDNISRYYLVINSSGHLEHTQRRRKNNKNEQAKIRRTDHFLANRAFIMEQLWGRQGPDD